VRIVALGVRRARSTPVPLAAFIRRERPDVLLTAMEIPSLVAVLSARLAGGRLKVVAGIRHVFSMRLALARTWQDRALRWAAPWAYRRAAAVIAVSDYVADDLAATAGVDRARIFRIYNPVPPDILERASVPLHDPLFLPGAPPVVIGIGRLVQEKDFATLVRAFAIVRRSANARLLILGEGSLRAELTALAAELGIADGFDLPGHVDNPYPYVRGSAVFVSSSISEAFGMAILEALACGTPVVGTDCPGGPAEILDHGRHGALVPVGRPDLMAEAILQALAAPRRSSALQARAAQFDIEATTTAYLSVLLPPETANED
jgi:glycosyltransferase involved in cell wall biosynthesis